MKIIKNAVLTASGKKPILFDVYYQETQEALPLVIFCHGYKGFKDWGAWDLVAKKFAENGFCFIKFNFSHNGGTVEQPIDFPDLEAFAENNFSTEMDDIDRVLTMVETGKNLPKLNSEINIIGHSRGGGIVLIKSEEDSRIKNVITWASISDFKARFQEGTENFEKWKETGVTFVENGRTKQQMPHNFQFYTDFKENEERFDIKRAVKSLQKPLLIIHGTEDPTVVLKEAKALLTWNPDSKFETIEGADHVFGASHPWEENKLPSDLQKVVDKTISFILNSK